MDQRSNKVPTHCEIWMLARPLGLTTTASLYGSRRFRPLFFLSSSDGHFLFRFAELPRARRKTTRLVHETRCVTVSSEHPEGNHIIAILSDNLPQELLLTCSFQQRQRLASTSSSSSSVIQSRHDADRDVKTAVRASVRRWLPKISSHPEFIPNVCAG